MSKAARVKLASVLYHAGFDLKKILDAIEYPMCVSIRQYFKDDETPVDVDAILNEGKKSETITLVADQTNSVLSSPHIPLKSYVEASGDHVFQFNYNKQGTSVMLSFTDNLSIPTPLNWPTLNFIKPKYPPPKT